MLKRICFAENWTLMDGILRESWPPKYVLCMIPGSLNASLFQQQGSAEGLQCECTQPLLPAAHGKKKQLCVQELRSPGMGGEGWGDPQSAGWRRSRLSSSEREETSMPRWRNWNVEKLKGNRRAWRWLLWWGVKLNFKFFNIFLKKNF